MTKTIKCPDPDCGNPVIIPDDAAVGNIVECGNCGAELEIVSINPLQVALITEEK